MKPTFPAGLLLDHNLGDTVVTQREYFIRSGISETTLVMQNLLAAMQGQFGCFLYIYKYAKLRMRQFIFICKFLNLLPGLSTKILYVNFVM